MSQKELAARQPREEDESRKKGFVGKAALISEIAGALSEKRSKETHQILASYVVVETISALVSAVDAKNAYEELLLSHASALFQKRNRASSPAAEDAAKSPDARPLSDEQAVVLALRGMGLNAKVTERKTTPSGIYIALTVNVEGESCRIGISPRLMEAEDPVAEAEKSIRRFGIRTREEERGMMLERRRQSRPPALPVESLGIDATRLERRKFTYDGRDDINGGNYFTYMGDGIESTFCISPDIRGKDLLAELDRRIFELHIKEKNVPFDASVIEEASGSFRSSLQIESIGQGGLKAIAKALDRMVFDPDINTRMVPAEYRESFVALRESVVFKRWLEVREKGVLKSGEEESFMRAMEILDHPAQRLVNAIRKEYTGQNGSVSIEGEMIIEATVGFHRDAPSGVCDEAVANIRKAYSMVSREDTSELDPKTLDNIYMLMVDTIREAFGGLRSAVAY
jgi:hypothetical protein